MRAVVISDDDFPWVTRMQRQMWYDMKMHTSVLIDLIISYYFTMTIVYKYVSKY